MNSQVSHPKPSVLRTKAAPSSSFIRKFLKYRYYYALLLPGLIYFIVFKYIPMGGVIIAFKDYKLTQGVLGSPWVGLKWFRILWSTGDFWNALYNTLLISFYKLIFGFPAPIALAILLNEIIHRRFKKIIQSILYFPHFLSWIVLGGILFAILSPGTGLISWLGFNSSPLMRPESFRSLLVVSHIWKEVGWGTVIYLAAIAGINPEMYEAARIDGANRFRLISHVTIPAISGTIVIMLILRTGQILSAGFDQVFILSNDVVLHVADILDTYVYRVGLSLGRFSIATAAGLFQSLAGLLLLLFTNWLARRFSDQGLW